MNIDLPQRSSERRLFLAAAIVFALVAVIGFARTYYLKGVFGTPALSDLIHVHAAVMTAWVALFVVQVSLVAANRRDLHRKLGVFGALLAVTVIGVGAVTAIESARHGLSPGGAPPLQFMAIPLGTLVVFGILVGAALAMRKRSDYHKRLMLVASLSIITPAIARFLLVNFEIASPPVFLGMTVVLIAAFVAWDTAKNRRLHPAFGWGFAFFLVSLPLRIVISKTGAWTQFATWMTT
jgi:uncharacterized membrane protein